jgi:hypothetical protein
MHLDEAILHTWRHVLGDKAQPVLAACVSRCLMNPLPSTVWDHKSKITNTEKPPCSFGAPSANSIIDDEFL